MTEKSFTKIGHLKTAAAFVDHVRSLGIDLPCDDRVLSAGEGSPMAQPIGIGGRTVGNRWCIHPMEGWDGTPDGQPTEPTLRRWAHFGQSGAKLIWGGEAFAVQSDGRANPNQLGIIDDDVQRAEMGLRRLLQTLTSAHADRFGRTDDLLVGLQLTHSGRFCRPYEKKKLEPKIAFHHPLLDAKFNIAPDDDSVLISDDYIEQLIDNYVRAAKMAQRVGFDFVDVKHCHGYLGHELLSARTRGGKYGGDLDNRTRFAREIVEAIGSECPGLQIGVRLSLFDAPPFKPDPARSGGGKIGPGIPEDLAGLLPYRWGFGCNPDNPLEIDLTEPTAFVQMLGAMGVRLINATCCSPYYNPHYQRPAIFPPSDGYQPPEDPLIGVARQIDATRRLKAACPEALFVGSGYSYLQEYLPRVAQAAVRNGWVDWVGMGRMVLSYWDLPADSLAGRPVNPKRLCRTFSDCTTAPRNGLISGCFPLDHYYKDAPIHAELKLKKRGMQDELGQKTARQRSTPSPSGGV